MPDIAMCNNTKCPLRHKCYRFTAKPSTWQTYGDFDYKNCKYFWDNSDREPVIEPEDSEELED